MLDAWGSPFEIKQLDDAGHIEGLAAAFGNVDHGGDKMLFGCVTKSLAERGSRPLPMLLYHDQSRPIGAWREWQEKPDGLYVKGKITVSSRDGGEAYALARDGGLTGISVGYQPRVKSIQGASRVLEAVDLHEASLVPLPMNDRARVTAVKSISGVRELEDLLRAGGLSGRKAKHAASAAWKAINEHDDDTGADAELAALFKKSASRLSSF